jgi:hypothetical protein
VWNGGEVGRWMKWEWKKELGSEREKIKWKSGVEGHK